MALFIEQQLSILGDQLKVLVFDFDQTITKFHTGGRINDPLQLTDEYIRNNVFELEFIRNLLPILHSRGIRLCIASFTDDSYDAISNPYSRNGLYFNGEPLPFAGKRLVKRYLDVIFGKERPFLQLDKDFQCWWPNMKGLPEDKNLHLALLSNIYIPKESVLLIDDSKSNVDQALIVGYSALQTSFGFDYYLWEQILKFYGIDIKRIPYKLPILSPITILPPPPSSYSRI